ncbi:hypothetical protein BHE74_00012055 [Ensete ventricosum]|nr:hypothetical protein BHE74_00012055 [Ensete ventricosum]
MAVVNIAEPDDSVVQEEHEEERKPRAPKRAAHQFRWRGSFPVRNQKGAVEPDSHSDVAEVSRETWVGRQRSTASGCRGGAYQDPTVGDRTLDAGILPF